MSLDNTLKAVGHRTQDGSACHPFKDAGLTHCRDERFQLIGRQQIRGIQVLMNSIEDLQNGPVNSVRPLLRRTSAKGVAILVGIPNV